MGKNTFFQLIIGGLIGIIAYQIYENSQILNALAIILLGTLLFYSFRSKIVAWTSIKLLQQPHIMALIGIGLGFTYISYNGFSFWPSTFFSVGTALIGFAIGIVIYGLWNLR